MGQLYVEMLGGFAVAQQLGGPRISLPRKKSQALLAYLASTPGRWLPRDALTAMLWGEAPTAEARNSFRVTLFTLRRALATTALDALRVKGDAVMLDGSAVETDVARFQAAAATRTPTGLAEAATLYTGDFLLGLRVDEPLFEEWLALERDRLRALALGTFERVLQRQLAERDDDGALASARRLLAIDPLQETAHRAVMELHAGQGRYGPALRQYQNCVAVLHRELGVLPSPETRRAYQRILQQRATVAEASDAGLDATLPSPAEPAMPAETPLLGRATEMGRLRRAMDSARSGRGSAVIILGETGIGKTRLVAEAGVLARRRGAVVLAGHAYEREQSLALGPWIEALRSAGPLITEPSPAGLEPGVRAELARLFPELGTPPPAVSGPEGRTALFSAVIRFLDALAARAPVVLVLEDLHWADEVTLLLLTFLGHRLRTMPLVVLATARDDDGDVSALRSVLDGVADAGVLVRMPLSPLAPREATRLVRALLPTRDDVEALSERVWRASGGVPLVVVETVRALQDPGAAETLLPGRLREIIERRLDRLGPRGRRLLDVAAVFRRPFEFTVLHRASELPMLDVAECVDELVGRRLLHAVDDALDLTHDRIRQVVLDRLAEPVRRALHGAVASAIEGVHADNLEPHHVALAEHWGQAERWDRAVEYWRHAGAAAAARGRYAEAVRYHEEAAARLDRLPDSRARLTTEIDVRLSLRNALYPLGDFARAVPELERAEAAARTLGDSRRLALISSYLCNSLLLTGRASLGPPFGEAARASAIELEDLSLWATANYHLAATYLALGEHAKAEELFTEVVSIVPPTRHGDLLGLTGLPVVFAGNLLAFSLAERGQFDKAIATVRTAVEIAERFEHHYSLAQALWVMGWVYGTRGCWGEAENALQRGLRLAEDHQLTHISPLLRGVLWFLYACTRRPEEGLALLTADLNELLTVDVVGFRALALVWGAATFRLTGNDAQARALAERALAMARASAQRPLEARALLRLAEVATSGNTRRSAAEAGFAISRELGMLPLQRYGHLILAGLAERDGASAVADDHRRHAASIASRLGVQPPAAAATHGIDVGYFA